MAVLGHGGVLDISRAIPGPTALSSARINTSNAVTTISLTNSGFWTGDRILIASSLGVPFDVNGDGYADCPDGHGIYRGGIWDTGISRSFYVGDNTDTSPFYRRYIASIRLTTQANDQLITQSGDILIGLPGREDREEFYNNQTNTGLSIQADGYMSRDELDRIRLWTTEVAAHAAAGTEKVISKVKCGNFIVAFYDDIPAYTAAINTAAAAINSLSLLQSEQALSNVIALPSGFETVCENLNRTWKLQGDLEEWVMSINADNLDITAIGETFGEHVKSLVRGAGSLQFLVDHRSIANEEDSLALLRLVLLTQNQCDTRAKFYLYKNRSTLAPRIDGSVYYECDIMLTNSSLNTRGDNIITGSADFVATSEIKIQVATS